MSFRDDDDEEELLPFENMEKAAVLQECKEFSAVSVNVPRCIEILTKVMYMMSCGEVLTSTEATDIFFGATKLFQCNESKKLRRILYVALKELSAFSDQAFIASASLVKDISTSNDDIYRANALRTLRKVTDTTMIGPMERYLKQAIVEKNNNVVSAAIVTGIHLAHTQPDMVKRWIQEVSDAMGSRSGKAQYHALALLHKLRKGDRVSVAKLVKQQVAGGIRSPLAVCLIIRMCAELMQEDFAQSQELYKWVNHMTHNSHDVIVFEAAKAICSLRNVSAAEVSPTVIVLQLYLTSHKPVIRFSCVRLMNRVATYHPSAVSQCQVDLEVLVADPNRNIATLAITTLLKTGNEHNMDRMMKQVTLFLDDLADEFKVVVIDAMKVLAVKFPHKYSVLLQFLSDAIREEGGAEYKRVIVETIVTILQTNPAARECALLHLCEYIEDCEYNALVQRVLFLVGQHGPLMPEPKKFIRYVYNRIQLEAAVVRAVAVTTLAKFAAFVPALRPTVTVLLQRTTGDVDDEVRDRATFYYRLFRQNDEIAIRNLVNDVASAVQRERECLTTRKPLTAVGDVAAPAFVAPAGVASVEEAAANAAALQDTGVGAVTLGLREKLRKIPQIRAFGEPLKTCEPVSLTEPDNEYVVLAVKHMYAEHVVLQFKVSNTMDDKVLRRVAVRSDCSELELAEALFTIPIERVDPGATEYAYLALKYEDGRFPTGSVANSFAFVLQDADDAEGEPDDTPEEYPLDEFALNLSDFVIKYDVGNFESVFVANQAKDTTGTYSLSSMRNLTAAAAELIDFFGMHVHGGKPDKITTKSHTIDMSGNLTNSVKALVLVRAKVFITTDNTIALTISVRGAEDELRQLLIDTLMS